MKVLFLGDIVGRPGRAAVRQLLPGLREQREISLVVANGENAAGGSGITAAIAEELLGCGIDGITLGDHVWDQKGFSVEIEKLERVCRPLNLPLSAPGRGHLILETADGFRLAVVTLLGKEYIKPLTRPGVDVLEAFLDAQRGAFDALLLEVHAEATSEKVAMGWLMDGRAAMVVGTHTHIPTADARILPGGTAYLTDAGMSGPYTSVLGREIGPILAKLRDGLPRPFPVATGDVRLCGLLVEINRETGLAVSCERIEERLA